MVRHGHHRDQVRLTVTGRRGELLEAAPADGHPRVLGQVRARGGGHARIGVDPVTRAKCGASFPASAPVPQPTSTAARRRAGRLRRIQPWKCSL
jgi:hypothetical protein